MLHTLSLLPNYGLRPDTVFDEVDHFLAHDPNIVPLGTHDGIPRYTTRKILAEERRILSAVDRLSARPGNALSEQAVSRQLEKNPTLSQEQVQFVRHLTQKNSAFRIGLGLAGTGKTSRAVKACVEAWQRRGYRVLIAAPTGQAARVVGNEISLQGETLTKFLGDFKFPLSAALIHHGWQFIRAARGKRTWRFRQPKPALITPKTIVLVDEAGMISTPQMVKLTELVDKGGGTLCLIGDPAQLPAVETTSPLHSLSRRYGAATLKDIRRQRALWARRAAKLFAAGRVGPALAAFAKKNRITVRDDIEEAVRQACLDWTAEGLLTPHRVLILANENHLTHTANQICQEHRLRAGVLQPDCSIRVTDEQEEAVYESRVYVHDRVIFTKNSRGRKGYGVDVDNGSLGTVTAIRPFTFTPEIAVVLDDGRHVRVNVSDYRHIRLGYSVSTYRAQGASIAKIHAIVGGTLQSLPSSYVQATRGVEDTFLYTTKDLLNASLENIQDSPLAKQMSRKPDLRLASDLLTDAPPSFRKRKPRIRRAAIEPSVPSVPHDQQPTPVLPPQSEPPKKTSPRPAPSSKRAPQSSQPPQAPKLPAANSLPSRRSSSPPKPLDRKSSQSPPLPAPIPPAQSQAPIPQSSHVTSSDSPFRPVIAVPPPQQPAASPYQSSLPPASSTSTSPPHAPSVPYYPSPVHASPAPHEPGSFRPAPFPDLSVPSTFAQAAQSLGIFPGGPPLPTPATIQPFDASSGFQRMRLPLGTWNVTTNPSVLSASCVDGGISDACRRAPAPVDQTMAFSSPSITVQRITPAPSALMTLEQATRAGVFSLIGTGCCDNLRVRCARGEVWQISVASHLALISAQNDIAPAEKHYNRPAVLTELSRLDQLDHQVMALSARRCFLTSLFACARRQIAWLLPAATDAVAIANTILGRLCQLLFEDPEANELLESYADSIRSLDILGIAKALQTSMSDLPHPPSPETLLAIGRAIAKGESEKEFLPACVQSVMKQYSSVVTEAALSSTIDTMAKTIVGAKIVFQRSQGTPQQAAAIVNVLYCAANRQPPQRIQVPSILTHHAGLEFAFLQAYPFARLVYDYANSYLNGNWDFVRGFYCNFKSIPWHR